MLCASAGLFVSLSINDSPLPGLHNDGDEKTRKSKTKLGAFDVG